MNYKTGLNTDNMLTILKSSISTWTYLIQEFCFKRVRKIRTIDIFEFVLQLAKNRSDGAQLILDTMYIEKNMISEHIFASSMSEARDKVVINMWKQILDDIAKGLRTEIKTRRYFAIDGTVLALQNAKFGGKFKKTNGSYVPHGYGSMLYDIDYGFPIDVILEPQLDERNAAIRHMEYLEAGDVVVMDRGYYSKALFEAFTNKGIHVVFRLKSNTFKNEWNSELDDIIASKDSINCRFVKYTINDTKYMLLTSLMDTELDSHDLIKTLYHKRWGIETAYGYVKDSCSLANLHGKTIEHLQQEFYANFILFTIARIMEYHGINKSKTHDVVGGIFKRNVLFNKTKPGKYEMKANFKKCISLVNISLHKILSGKIDDCIDQLTICIVSGLSPIRPDRHFKRVSISPRNKWQHHRNMKNDIDAE